MLMPATVVNPLDLDLDLDLERAVRCLRAGGLVAFPTETVYGLGADAERAEAVQRIFEVKGRPFEHPLIVHLGDAAELSAWAKQVPETAQRLADAFWPGPLTLIVERSERVAPNVTGGLPTVGLRVPDHPVALQLLQRFGGGVAAPSANRFGKVSPTRAEHVRQDLGSDVDVIVDGGPCRVGVESTIVDVTSAAPRILRHGGISRERLEDVLGVAVPFASSGPVRAPGQLEAHYAPRAEVILVSIEEAPDRARALARAGRKVLLLSSRDLPLGAGILQRTLPAEPEGFARQLYAALRDADALGCDAVIACPPAEAGLGAAIRDRLRRAAAGSKRR